MSKEALTLYVISIELPDGTIEEEAPSCWAESEEEALSIARAELPSCYTPRIIGTLLPECEFYGWDSPPEKR